MSNTKSTNQLKLNRNNLHLAMAIIIPVASIVAYLISLFSCIKRHWSPLTANLSLLASIVPLACLMTYIIMWQRKPQSTLILAVFFWSASLMPFIFPGAIRLGYILSTAVSMSFPSLVAGFAVFFGLRSKVFVTILLVMSSTQALSAITYQTGLYNLIVWFAFISVILLVYTNTLPPAVIVSPKISLKAALAGLNARYKYGLISQEKYKAKKMEIINRI